MSTNAAAPCDARGNFRVLLIGASGQFGSKLARLLGDEKSIELVLAGRRHAPLERLQQDLGYGQIRVMDRESLDANTLQELDIDIVADLSGPYQEMNSTVVKAAIGAGVHYIDIADSRAYINTINKFDSDAREASCAILTGASSTPALSHAVIDELTRDWQRIDTIEATISPSNSQDYGLSVIRGILGQLGKPMTLFTAGIWRTVPYWSDTDRRVLPNVGTRYTSLVETPDNDLFVARYQPIQSAHFRASLELTLMHLSVSALSRLVQIGLIGSAGRLASPLQKIANKLSLLSTQYGGMVVTVKGRNAAGDGVLAEWSLSAKGDAGPHVPVLACLIMVRKFSEGAEKITGAHNCAGLVSLHDVNPEFAKLDIDTQTRTSRLPKPPFATALGESFATLPTITQEIHLTKPSRKLQGEVTINGASNPVARIIATLFHMPSNSAAAEFMTAIEMNESGSEDWARYFPDQCMRSQMGNPDHEAQTIDECFGPFRFTLQLHAHEAGIDMHLLAGRLLGVHLPRFCLPKITATERAAEGRHLFNVDIQLPFIGRLVHYRGWLAVKD